MFFVQEKLLCLISLFYVLRTRFNHRIIFVGAQTFQPVKLINSPEELETTFQC